VLHLVNSNHPEALRDALLRRLASHGPADPFAALQVIVPSIALRGFVQQGIADAFGVCANVQFSFLAQWLWAQAAQLLPVAARSPLDAQSLAWRIYAALEDQTLIEPHPRLAAWLAQADPAMQYELALSVANLFDKYATYRPQWIEAWLRGEDASLGNTPEQTEAGQDQAWQRALWQRLAQELGLPARHPFAEFQDVLTQKEPGKLARLPQQVHVFCLPTVPPVYLDALVALSAHMDVHLYLHNPCRDYWFDIVDPRRLSYLAARGQAQYLEVGNRMLAMWGRQSRAFLEQLLNKAAPASDEEAFVDTLQPGLLGCLQAAVLDMEEIEAGSAAGMESDGSISLHSCHTLARELEVLHDQLLAAFNDAHDPLTPSQVLVVLPDLEQAASLVDAVFGSAGGTRHIPYRITGRPASSANLVAAALLELLSLAGTRHYASQVHGLLQNPLVAAAFGLDAGELDVVLGWLANTRTQWGLDAAQRQHFGAPPTARHSFEEGLSRLYLGYALPHDADAPYADLLAPCNVEGEHSRILAALDHFVERLARCNAQLQVPARPAVWRDRLLAMLDNFVHAGSEQLEAMTATRAAILDLVQGMQAAADLELPLPVLRAALKDALGEATRGGAPTGSVTFAALPSLRAIPYDMVCLLGMNDGAFPSQARNAEFDLMRYRRLPGDRDRREEERNLFLDLLLAARKKLYLSYTGRSVRDNAPLPPSVLVSDLLDVLGEACALDPASRASRQAARAALVLEHPLQAFSPAYFDGRSARLFSYHEDYCRALRMRPSSALATPSDSAFFAQPLGAVDAEQRQLTPEQLVEFFRHPGRYLLRHRLRLMLPDEAPQIEDDEAFLPNGLGRYDLAQRLLPHMLAGASASQIEQLARAGLEYPAGVLGEMLLKDELAALQAFAQRLAPELAGPLLPPQTVSLPFTLENEAWLLEGALADLRANGLVRYRYGSLRAVDYLAAWIHHLVLNCSEAEVRNTQWIGREESIRFLPVPDAREQLGHLLDLLRQGLHAPLHFYPRSAWAAVQEDGDVERARKEWEGSAFAPGEGDDPAWQLVMRGGQPLDQAFLDTARAVFAPMFDYLQVEPA
jgi:exodeoxyribonuclease V gamma subunit